MNAFETGKNSEPESTKAGAPSAGSRKLSSAELTPLNNSAPTQIQINLLPLDLSIIITLQHHQPPAQSTASRQTYA